MKTIIHKASERGHANHGWLQANHSFSFAGWFHPDKINFGALRVLNDDRIAAGAGFPEHPHQNMEIITIPLSGTLEHKDSMGNTSQIKAGDIQVMSAGKGVYHSEYNASSTEDLTLFQIWIFSNKENVEPRYGEMTLDVTQRHNTLQEIISPQQDNDTLWLHQDAWMYLSDLDAGKEMTYTINKPGNGVYVMVVDGHAQIAGQLLGKRDAIGVSGTDQFTFTAVSNTQLLFIEVPMDF